MKVPVYKAIAIRLGAIHNCIASDNNEWQEKHEHALSKIEENHLPRGSGIDAGVTIEGDPHKIVLRTSFHVMNENGFYDRCIPFQVVVTASLQNDFDINIIGNFGKYQDLKDYLYDLFQEYLTNNI